MSSAAFVQANLNAACPPSRPRRTSIPRPSQSLIHARTAPNSRTATSRMSSHAASTMAVMIQPRTYSRSRRSSFTPRADHPPPARRPVPALLPQSDSLLPYRERSDDGDLSGVQQQLPIRNYSMRSIASLDAVLAASDSQPLRTLPPRGREGLPKSNTSTSLAHLSTTLTPQRQLMRPLGPPIPRSQTTGSLSCFGAADPELSPASIKRLVSPPSTINADQVGVIDVLLESRMPKEELKYFNQISREGEANKRRLRLSVAERMASCKNDLNLLGPGAEASIRRSETFPTLPLPADRDLYSRKLQQRATAEHKMQRSHSGGNRLSPHVSFSSPVFTPDSGISLSSNPGDKDDKEVNARLVYADEPRDYWRGRFSTLLDRLRTENHSLISSNFVQTKRLVQPDNAADTFEAGEFDSIRVALDELRGCCCTSPALRSFEEFELPIRRKLDRQMEKKSLEQFYSHPAASRANFAAAGLMPKRWPFMQCREISGGPPDYLTRSSWTDTLAKSKTMGNLQSMKSSLVGTTTVIQANHPKATGKADSGAALSQRRRQSYVGTDISAKSQEQALVKAESVRKANNQASIQASRRSSCVGAGTKGLAHGSWEADHRALLIGKGRPRRESRKSSGTSTETIKKIFSEGVKGMRKMRRSLTGAAGSGE